MEEHPIPRRAAPKKAAPAKRTTGSQRADPPVGTTADPARELPKQTAARTTAAKRAAPAAAAKRTTPARTARPADVVDIATARPAERARPAAKAATAPAATKPAEPGSTALRTAPPKAEKEPAEPVRGPVEIVAESMIGEAHDEDEGDAWPEPNAWAPADSWLDVDRRAPFAVPDGPWARMIAGPARVLSWVTGTTAALTRDATTRAAREAGEHAQEWVARMRRRYPAAESAALARLAAAQSVSGARRPWGSPRDEAWLVFAVAAAYGAVPTDDELRDLLSTTRTLAANVAATVTRRPAVALAAAVLNGRRRQDLAVRAIAYYRSQPTLPASQV